MALCKNRACIFRVAAFEEPCPGPWGAGMLLQDSRFQSREEVEAAPSRGLAKRTGLAQPDLP